jgi:hypothetical protein
MFHQWTMDRQTADWVQRISPPTGTLRSWKERERGVAQQTNDVASLETHTVRNTQYAMSPSAVTFFVLVGALVESYEFLSEKMTGGECLAL